MRCKAQEKYYMHLNITMDTDTMARTRTQF